MPDVPTMLIQASPRMRAAIHFHPWAALLPSPATGPVDALAAYVEIVAALASDRHGLDMVGMLLQPRMHAAAEAIHASPHLPPVPQVLDALKPALRGMPRTDVRAWLAGTLRGMHKYYSGL